MNWSLFGLFGSGLATFLSPCVLPMAPILVASWSTSSASKSGRLFSTLWFTLGFTLTFVLLGLSASAMSGYLAPAKPLLFAFGGVILALFALRMIGIIQGTASFAWLQKTFQLPDYSRKAPSGLAALTFGLIFGLSWTPCVGPVLGAFLTYVASKQSTPLQSALMLFVFSLGISLPLLALAVASEHLKPLLDRLRGWIPKIEYAMGAGLLIFSITLLNQARIAFAEPNTAWSTAANTASNTPLGPVTAHDQKRQEITLGARTPGHSRMVFFHSENCPICRAMENYLPEFEKSCASSAFDFSKVDVDLNENRTAAERFQIRAVPALSIFNDEGQEIVHLVGYLTEGRLREATRTLSGLLCQETQTKLPLDAPLIQENQTCSVGQHC
ncbi:MAG: sulfite exporter TauE/SafE family protein [Methylotenera sp.]|nr:sulfite exporter TauE/SafE family protein [Oligoflexia bacterium]